MSDRTVITLRRGNLAAIPILAKGEPAFCLDTGDFFVGNGVSNVKINGARIPPGVYGDITVDVLGTTWTVNAGVITMAKLADLAQFRVIGRIASGAGVPIALTIADLMTFANNFVTVAKLEQIAKAQLLGRKSAGTGNVEIISFDELLAAWGNTAGDLLYCAGGTWGKLAIGQANAVLEPVFIGGSLLPTWVQKNQVIVLDAKASGTNGGTFTQAVWQTRTLNTTQFSSTAFASLAGNVLTLPAGTWRLRGRAPAAVVNAHQCRLYDVTAGTMIAPGSSANAGPGIQTDSNVEAIATFGVTTGVRLEHICALTGVNTGFGAPVNAGVTEVYAELRADQLS